MKLELHQNRFSQRYLQEQPPNNIEKENIRLQTINGCVGMSHGVDQYFLANYISLE
jgi:hypothetical protein